MDAVYHWVGIAVVWLGISFLSLALSWRLYDRIIEKRWGNALLWVRVFVFRKQWRLTRRKARMLTAAYQPTKQLARWERNIIAYAVKQARRHDWWPEELST